MNGGIEYAIGLAEERWPFLEFHIKSSAEAESSCPFCGGKDRFATFADEPRYWCRQCGESGFLENKDPHHKLTEAELTEIRLRRLERKQEEFEKRLTALERLQRSNAYERYHDAMDEEAYTWWASKGCEAWMVHDYKLGMCSRCPTDGEHRRSYTIPLFDQGQERLLNLRHRIGNAQNGDKYRPEMAGLGTCLAFPHHLIDAERAIVLEGEIKSLVCGAHGLPTVGLFGKRGRFKPSWLEMFPAGAPIYIALDPDATDSADRLGHGLAKLGKEVYVAEFPAKPDDILVDGATVDDWMGFIHLARRVH